MPFDYENNVAAVYNVLFNHNTTTATPDLSSGLTTRIKNIFRTDPEISIPQSLQLPAIYIRINNKEEVYAGLGPTGPARYRKEATVNYDIIGLYIKDGLASSLGTLLVETYRLAENIEGVFQQEFDLSTTALWCNPVSTNFLPAISNDASIVKGMLIQLQAKYHFR